MLKWLRDWWQKVTTSPCNTCGEFAPVSAYRKTGRSQKKEGLFGGVAVELECPNCDATFWVRK